MSKEVKVGIFSVMVIAMFYLGFNYLKGIDFFTRSNKYYVLYEDVGGLTKSNPVTISGFSVGKVSDINLLQSAGNMVLVEIDVDSKIQLGDSAVAFLDAGLLGGVSIVLDVGDLRRPLEPGDTLHASVTPGLTELFKESTEPLMNSLPLLLANLNDFLIDIEGSGEQLKLALASFTATSNTLNATLIENQDSIKGVVSGFKTLTVKLGYRIDEMKPLLAKFDIMADSLNNLELSNTLDNLNKLLAETSVTVETLNSSEGTLGKLMKDDALYNNLNQAMADLDTLLVHMNENPKHFFGPLGKSQKKIQKDLEKQQSQ
jgi:phospholipid/cholesterol/gamma-HCH transport system substrate-binding protein